VIEQIDPGRDTLDVWFDSGTAWSTLPVCKSSTADLVIEGTDQFRGWFQSLFLTRLLVAYKREFSLQESSPGKHHPDSQFKEAIAPPFKALCAHGFVLDASGRKMSKSLGNVMLPDDLLGIDDKLGQVQVKGMSKSTAASSQAESQAPHNRPLKRLSASVETLRLWVASSDWTLDVRVGEALLQRHAEHKAKLRNTFRFILGNIGPEWQYPAANSSLLAQPRPTSMASRPSALYSIAGFHRMQLSPMDRYVLALVHREGLLIEDCWEAPSPRTATAVSRIMSLCIQSLSAFYFDISKDILYADPEASDRRRATVATLEAILPLLTQWIAPVLPFLAQQIYDTARPLFESRLATSGNLQRGRASVLHLPWQRVPAHWQDDKLLSVFDSLLAIRQQFQKQLFPVLKARRVAKSTETILKICGSSASGVREDGIEIAGVKLSKADLALIFLVSRVEMLERSFDPLADELLRFESRLPASQPDNSVSGMANTLGEDRHSPGFTFVLVKSTLEKCPRCWLHTREREKPLCERCSAMQRRTHSFKDIN
jgi:isoleucyl-tRNA synthetase